jgi:uncharacterized OB-fold protein
MSSSDSLVVNEAAASAEPCFVAPDLVQVDAQGMAHLVAGRCRACRAYSFPRAAVCTSCLCEDIEPVALSRDGTLYSYSVVHQAPKGWRVPYALGYVDLAEGVRVLAHIDVPLDALAVDMPLRLGVGVVGSDAAGAPMMSYTFTTAP